MEPSSSFFGGFWDDFYTDHGIRHVQNVLEAAEWVIADASWTEFSPEDSAVLTMAVLLHDAAMHLSPCAFLDLLRDTRNPEPLETLGDLPWPSLWSDFRLEIRHWSGGALGRVFGDTSGLHDLRAVLELPSELGDPLSWDEARRRLIGEFIRRHHGRLAHEIARAGVPGATEKARERFSLGDESLTDLAGLVARV